MSQQKTKFYTKDQVKRDWRLIDAEGKILGRLAVEVANALRGKDKAEFTPNQDCGDFVVIVNAEKFVTCGNKEEQKEYHRHSGYPGGHRVENLKSLKARRPEEVIRKAVKGMLPHNKLSDQLITKLKIYKGPEHKNSAQLKETVAS